MTDLVTGAGGFIGANLVRRLRAQGADVVGLVRPGSTPWRLAGLEDLRLLEADLADADALRAAVRALAPRRIFHLAAHGAYSWQRDLTQMIAVNVAATAALLDAFAGEAFVHAGSSSEYGVQDHATREFERIDPDSHYAVTKAAATHLCAMRERAGGPGRVLTLRLYSIYGPWEEPGRLVPALVRAALDGRLPPLTDPRTARDFVYVDDACSAFLAAASGEAGPAPVAVVNVASGRQTSLAELVALAREVLGAGGDAAWGSMPDRSWDTTVWTGDPELASDALDWRAATSLADGLATTARWMGSDPALLERYNPPLG